MMIHWTYLFVPVGICFCLGIWYNEYFYSKYLELKSHRTCGRTAIKVFDNFYMIVPEDEYIMMNNLYIDYMISEKNYNLNNEHKRDV